MSLWQDFYQPRYEALNARIKELEDAIKEHAAQRGDDRCWVDDLKLYKLVGIEEHPGLKLPEEEFLSNCKRYWKCQQTGERYMGRITSFRGEYEFLSNFYPSVVVLDGMKYPTVEHAYQASKTESDEQRYLIGRAETPAKAKRLGRKAHLRPDWDDNFKTATMRDLLHQKFKDPDLRQKLLDTYPKALMEGNTWGDKYWGAVWEHNEWSGSNVLGSLLVRERLMITHEIQRKYHVKSECAGCQICWNDTLDNMTDEDWQRIIDAQPE